jgi:hypothetical protein
MYHREVKGLAQVAFPGTDVIDLVSPGFYLDLFACHASGPPGLWQPTTEQNTRRITW